MGIGTSRRKISLEINQAIWFDLPNSSVESQRGIQRTLDLRLPNRQAANEKIEAHFFSWSITSGLPVIQAQSPK
jgi:hypothetical protein